MSRWSSAAGVSVECGNAPTNVWQLPTVNDNVNRKAPITLTGSRFTASSGRNVGG